MKKSILLTPVVVPAVRELATMAHEGTPCYGDYGHPSVAPVPEKRVDTRAAGGNLFDLRNEQSTL
jgi:hypothetical protein